MSDNQRRAVCRILFLLCCAFPTGFVGYWICHPQTTNGWQNALQAQLGVTTSIDSIETPGPYVTVLRGLEFTDPEVGTLFKAVEAKIEFGKEKNIISIPYRVQGLTNKGLSCFLEKVNENLMRAHRVDRPWRIRFEKGIFVEQKLDVENLVNPQFEMCEFRIDISPWADGTRADLSFKVPHSEAPQRLVQGSIQRSNELGHHVILKTDSVALPCWLVSDVVPYLNSSLGDSVEFAGRVDLVPTPGKSRVIIDGVFDKVDLERSVAILPTEERIGRIELIDFQIENNNVSKGEGWIQMANTPRLRIHPNDLFGLTRQVDPMKAISGAFERYATRVADQKTYR